MKLPSLVGVKSYRLGEIARLRVASALGGLRARRSFDELRTFCLFVGYPRSGHSLVGSLIDAHREAVIAHELDALLFLARGFGRLQLLDLVVRSSREFSEGGREWTGYRYEVPGQWQGRASPLCVAGDKKGGNSTRRLDADPALLDRLRGKLRVPVKIVHVVRDPLDVLGARWRRKKEKGLDVLIARHFALTDAVARLKRRVDPGDLLDVHHEDLIADPRRELRRMAAFLGLSLQEDWVEACAGIVFPAPRRSRHEVPWTDEALARVRAEAAKHDFLKRYETANGE